MNSIEKHGLKGRDSPLGRPYLRAIPSLPPLSGHGDTGILKHGDMEIRRCWNTGIKRRGDTETWGYCSMSTSSKVPASPRLRVPLSRNASLRPRVWEGVTLKRILSFHRAPFLLVRPVQGWH